jgi:acyl carrier protein
MNKRAKILSIIQAVSKKQVQPEADESLFDSGLLDSFALPDMVSALEKEFGVSIPDSDLNPRKFDSIERIESYLENR